MTKTFSVLALAVAVLILALALMIVDTDKVRARSTCPSGAQKFAHVCIEKSARTAATFDNASSTCAAAKRRLPTSAELDAFRQQSGVVIGGDATGNTQEWTSEFLNATNAAMGITGKGSRVADAVTSTIAFRCVA